MKPPLSRKTLLWGIGTQKKGKYYVLWWNQQIGPTPIQVNAHRIYQVARAGAPIG